MSKAKIDSDKTLEFDENPFSSFLNFFYCWKKFGFLSSLHWRIITLWGIFIYFIGYKPIQIITHPRLLDSYFNIASAFDPVLLIVSLSYIVIAAGTTIYAYDVFKQTFNANKNIKGLFILYLVSALACIACDILCWNGLSELNVSNNIHDVVETTEFYTLYVFITLLGIDTFMLIAKVLEIKYYKSNSHKEELKISMLERKFIFNQMLFIDMPVLLGVYFIYEYVHGAGLTGFYDTNTIKFESFKTFFAVGAIGMHIIFSQFIFLVLNTKNIYSEISRRQAK